MENTANLYEDEKSEAGGTSQREQRIREREGGGYDGGRVYSELWLSLANTPRFLRRSLHVTAEERKLSRRKRDARERFKRKDEIGEEAAKPRRRDREREDTGTYLEVNVTLL